ncbi:MAG: nuclear transport factor 2 family protein [Clostridiales bacterium]|nr:nuclear transport factor 2 family protein [Clostridiales bacterium]
MKEKLLEISKTFWNAMEHADEDGMRRIADAGCTFVHIGITCGLDQEIEFYTNGTFQPTEIRFNSQVANLYGDTGIVITDCNYGLLLDGKATSHHFAVTEVYVRREKNWSLVSVSFTALVY